MIILSHRIFLLDEVFVSYNLHFGVSGGFFQGAKLRTLVYVICQRGMSMLQRFQAVYQGGKETRRIF